MFVAIYLPRGEYAPVVGKGSCLTICLGFKAPCSRKLWHFLALTAIDLC